MIFRARICGAALCCALSGFAKEGTHWFAMDTEFSATVFGPGSVAADMAFARLRAEADRLERRFSDYLPGSDLHRLAGKKGDTLRLDAESAGLFAAAEELAVATRGRFDITLGPLKRAYGLGSSEKPRVPDSAEIARLLADHPAYRGDTGGAPPFQLLVTGGGTLHSQPHRKLPVAFRLILLRDCEFDLGALAKGYAVDRLSALLDSLGFPAHLVQAGGDMRFSGRKPGSHPWRVGIRHPRRPDTLCGMLQSGPFAVSTSGDYERYFLRGGRRYHHILDPATGAPARDFCSVTVVAGSSRVADGLSTSLFVLGPRLGMPLMQAAKAEALWVRENAGGSLCALASPGFFRYLESLAIPYCPDHGG